jgi:hypothetical protein
MPLLTKIKAVLQLNNDDFKRGLKDSEKQTQSFGKAIGKIGGAIAAAFAVREVVQWGGEMAKLSTTARNVGNAFERIARPGYLNDLRRATGGMTTDLQLMQNSIQAVNLGLEAADLPKYFEFAAVRAQETGESVDYLVNSIVTGIGRKSPLILDNLGISITRINEEMKNTGDFAQAAANIIQEELAKSPAVVEEVASGVDQLTVAWANFGLAVSESGIGYAFDQLAKKAASFLQVWSGKGASQGVNTFLLQTTNLADLTKGELVEALDIANQKFTETMGSEYWLNRMLAIQKAMADLALKARQVNDQIEETPPTLNELNKELAGLKNLKGTLFDPNEILKVNLQILELEKRIKSLNEIPSFGGEGITPMEALGIDIDLTNQAAVGIAKYRQEVQKTVKPVLELGDAMASSLGQAIAITADSIGQLISGDTEGALQSFISGIAGLMKQFGSLLIAWGAAQLAIKASAANPYVAIAAGAALVAIGALMSSKTAQVTGSGYYGGSGYGSYSGGTFGGGGFGYEREIILRAKGDDLVGVIIRNNFRNG